MTQPDTSFKRHVDYICWGCAGMYGADATGNNITVHPSQCDNCGSQTLLASVDDWNWPKGKPAKWCGAGRD